MARRLVLPLVVLAALVAAPATFAAYPGPLAVQGGLGVETPDGVSRFVAFDDGAGTLLAKIDQASGTRLVTRTLHGSFGVPVLLQGSAGEGLSRDGSFFVLQSTGIRRITELKLVDTGTLATRASITLRGSFAYDALSPDGRTLYLIQHTAVSDLEHYVVRAYDLDSHALLPGRIADRTQKGWVMQGFPTKRTTSLDGRYVFTLYDNPGGYPFIHALDTVHAVAHCVGVPWPGPNQSALSRFVLSLHDKTLVLQMQDGKPWLRVDISTWKVTRAG